MSKKSTKPSAGRPADTSMPEKTASWPGTPGPKQPKDRSGGTPKLQIHPKSEGI